MAVFASAAAIAIIAFVLPTPAPAGWRGLGQLSGAGRVQAQLPDGPGWAVLVVDRSPRRMGRLIQNMVQPDVLALRGQGVTTTALVRSADGEPAPGRLIVRDTAGFSQLNFVATGQWQPVTLQHTVAMTTSHIRLVMAPGLGRSPQEMGQLLVAELAVRPTERRRAATTLLSNGDFTRAARLGEVLAAALEDRWRQYAPQLPADPTTLQPNLLYLALTFAGYWGNFGWLQRPLPLLLYALLALVSVTAGAGVLLRWRREPQLRAVVAAWVLAALFIAAQVFLPMIGRPWQPQGRYLFPALLPLTGLLLVGLDYWLRFDTHQRRRTGLLVVLLAFDLVGLATAARVF